MKIAALKIYTLATNSHTHPPNQHTLPEGEGLGWCPHPPALFLPKECVNSLYSKGQLCARKVVLQSLHKLLQGLSSRRKRVSQEGLRRRGVASRACTGTQPTQYTVDRSIPNP